MVQLKEIARTDKDTNFYFVVRVVNNVGIGKVLVGFKPKVVNTWVGEVIMPRGISPGKAKPGMASVVESGSG